MNGTYESKRPKESDIGNPSDSFSGVISSFLREQVVRSVSGSKLALGRRATARHIDTGVQYHRIE